MKDPDLEVVAYTELALGIRSFDEEVPMLIASVKDPPTRVRLATFLEKAGLDGFWIHRALEREGIESHIVDAASIMTSRRRRRAKTDRIDGEALLRALMAYNRGEPRVCAMLRVPTPEDEDRRRISRERQALIAERVIKGLLFSQGIRYEPLRRDRRARLEELRTGDGRRATIAASYEAADQPRAPPAGIASRTDQSGRG